jgi:hypothetical protein
MLSAYAWSLGLAAPSNIFGESELDSLLAKAAADINFFGSQFSNGNLKLEKGIKAQHRIALELYQRNVNLPLEMNLCMDLIMLNYYADLTIVKTSVAGYSGPTPMQDLPNQNFVSDLFVRIYLILPH